MEILKWLDILRSISEEAIIATNEEPTESGGKTR